MSKTFLINLTTSGHSQTSSKTQLTWSGEELIQLPGQGQWILELIQRVGANAAFRLRSLSAQTDNLKVVSLNETAKLGSTEITVTESQALSTLFTGQANEGHTSKVTLFKCAGNAASPWILDAIYPNTEPNTYPNTHKETPFTFTQKGKQIVIHSKQNPLEIILNDNKILTLLANEQTSAESSNTIKIFDPAKRDLFWIIADFSKLSDELFQKNYLDKKDQTTNTDTADRNFKRATQFSAAALTALLGLTWILPSKKPMQFADSITEIPAQYTRIVMDQSKGSGTPAEAKGTRTGSQTTQVVKAEKAEKTAIAQAFRAKALQSAVSGLLKGGMTKLLAQSNFASGSVADSQKTILAHSLTDSLTASPGINSRNIATTDVGTVGGKNGVSGGVGYKTGSQAQLKGQGKMLVQLESLLAQVEEGLTKDEVGEIIHKHASEVRYCYESAMIRSPDLEGKLILHFTISSGGLVSSTAVKTSTLPDPRLEDCVIRRLLTWKFPQPKGGIDVPVTYPFVFKTLGG